MNRLALGVLGAVVLAGGLAAWAIHKSAQIQLRQKREAWRQQGDQLALWSAENARLSSLIDHGKSAVPLSEAEARELRLLRNQMGLYRKSYAETEALRATNQQLEADVAGILTNAVYWSGSQLTNEGFADPEAAMKSTLWAWIYGDTEAFLASLTPEENAELAKLWEGKSEGELATRTGILANLYRPATEGVCVLNKRTLSPDKAVLELYFEGDGKRREFELKKFGNEWRVTSLRAIFN
jgi:hypothetical protein